MYKNLLKEKEYVYLHVDQFRQRQKSINIKTKRIPKLMNIEKAIRPKKLTAKFLITFEV